MSDTLRINNLFTTAIGYSTLTGSTITTNSLSLSTLTVSSINSGAPGVAAYSTLNVSTLNATSTITASTITTTSNVGVGTNAPGSKLHIFETATNIIRMQTSASDSAYIVSTYEYVFLSANYTSAGVRDNTGRGSAQIVLYQPTAGGIITFNTSPSINTDVQERMRILANGNVGIGITNHTYPLSVAGTIQAINATNDTMGLFSTTYGGYLHIGSWTASGGGSKNIVMQQMGGNVGIGITNPGYLLDVNGTLNIRGSFTVNGVAVATGTGSVWTVGASNAIYYSAGNTCLYRNRLIFSNAINDFNHCIYNNGFNVDSEGNWDGMKFNVFTGAWFRVGNAGGATPTTAMYINTSGYVGIGLTTPATPLHVNGFATTSSNAPATFFAAGSTVLATPGTSQNASIYASNVIQTATGFVAGSDRRIKKNITPVVDSLAKLDALTIVSYDRINFREEGADAGVIAQDVKAILPHAVSAGTSYIPNIYQRATHSIQNTTVHIIVDSIAADVKDNTKVRLYVSMSDREKEYETNLFHLTGNSFDVAVWENYSPADKVFVYGIEVDDFLSVDKDQIGMLAAAGVKELIKQNAEQAEKITTLESQLSTVLSRLNAAGIA